MVDILIVSVFLASCLGLGARQYRDDSSEGWILAGRTLTLPLFVSTLVPTFYGGVLGIGEFTWTAGLSNWLVMALPYYVFSGIYALFLAERVRLTPGLTIPDHLRSAYGRPTALLGAVLLFVLASPADELLMAGTLLEHLSGLSAATASAVAGFLALALIWRAGLRSDVSANRLQIVAMFAGFALIIPYSWHALGSPADLAARLPSGHLTATGGLGIWKLASWWLLALWTIVDPSFHQRCAAAANPAVAKRGILISILFWAVFDFMTTLAGLYARAALPSLDAPILAFPRLADAVMPAVARGLFFAGISASLFAALQSTSMIAAACLGHQHLRTGLILTMMLSFALSRLQPSVVELWYGIGSAAIPGLLLPVLGVYFPRWRVTGPWALYSSSSGAAASLLCLLLYRLIGRAPWTPEPLLAGLALSSAVWTYGRLRSSPDPNLTLDAR
ncbi:MAG: hypothetical protein AAB036_00500 [Elusimicrobiota bacterium]